jgi:hypothetical protein
MGTMQIAICAIFKNENLYLREWVEYHKKIGFDKIILYDNNDINGEYPHQVIGDYIMNGYVEVHNVRGHRWRFKVGDVTAGLQPLVYQLCRIQNKDKYDWMAFIDIDEFITIDEKQPQNIHEIFEKYGYDRDGFEQVLMSWYIIGDDGKLHYEQKPVQERFNKHIDSLERKDSMCDLWVKSIVRTNIPDDKTFSLGNEHAIPNLYSCSEFGLWVTPGKWGELCTLNCAFHNILYVKHYCTKSFWENFTHRLMNIDRTNLNIDQGNFLRMDDYKSLNGWTEEHNAAFHELVKYVSSKDEFDESQFKVKEIK